MSEQAVVTPEIGSMKETQEVLNFFIGVGEAVKEVMANDKLDFTDLKVLPQLGSLSKDAVLGSQGIVSEFKEANGEALEQSAQLLAKAALEMIEAWTLLKGYLQGR